MPEPIRISDERGREIVIGVIQHLNLAKPWSVEIKPYRKKRTLNQNAYYWKLMDDIAQAVHDATGNSKDDLHAFFKAKFLPVKVVDVAGEQRVVPVSITTLNLNEMSDLITKVLAWCEVDLGLPLPDPRDYGRE